MTDKKCSSCNNSYPATTDHFHKDKNRRDGLHPQCKVCRLSHRKRRYSKDKVNGTAGLHYQDNRLQYIVHNMNRRSDVKLTAQDVDNRLKEFLNKEGKVCCVYCKRTIEDDNMLHLDHFIPIASGGTNKINNIMPTCRYCNRSKWDEDFTYWYRNQVFYDASHEEYVLNLANVI